MFDFLFPKSKEKEVVVADKPDLKGKTTKEIVEEIHETFYTEVDRLLHEAGIKVAVTSTNPRLQEKGKRLARLGFSGSQEAKFAESEKTKKWRAQSENSAKDRMIEVINYFNMKYPLYKFITEESVQKICQKYNLIYGPASRYIGTVPDKNLLEMEKFSIKDEDRCYEEVEEYRGHVMHKGFISTSAIAEKQKRKQEEIEMGLMPRISFGDHVYERTQECPLEIAAPKKDFDTKGMELKGFKLQPKVEIPDPVVLQPVYYKGNKYYLIVTAWGAEAEDELVVNQKFN